MWRDRGQQRRVAELGVTHDGNGDGPGTGTLGVVRSLAAAGAPGPRSAESLACDLGVAAAADEGADPWVSCTATAAPATIKPAPTTTPSQRTANTRAGGRRR